MKLVSAPDINGNLLSVKRLLDKGFNLNFHSDKGEILKNGKEIGIADQGFNLFWLRQPNKVSAVDKHNQEETNKSMCANGLVDKCGKQVFCEPYPKQIG